MGIQDRDWYKESPRHGNWSGGEWAVALLVVILLLIVFL